MNENTSWAIIAVATLIFLSLSVHGCSGYFADKNAKIVEMVNAGANPIKAHCGLSGIGGNACVVLAAQPECDDSHE